jgi:hypothetical protein
MPVIIDVLRSIRYIFEFLGMLFRSIVEQTDVLSETVERVWGVVYWGAKDAGLIANLVVASDVEISVKEVLLPVLDFSTYIGAFRLLIPAASRGIVHVLKHTGDIIANEANYGYVVSELISAVLGFLTYLIEFIAHFVVPWA